MVQAWGNWRDMKLSDTATQPVPRPVLDPDDILTPQQLADRLQVPLSWVFERTKKRAQIRSKHPMPYLRLSDKVVRFSWHQISEWLTQNNS